MQAIVVACLNDKKKTEQEGAIQSNLKLQLLSRSN